MFISFKTISKSDKKQGTIYNSSIANVNPYIFHSILIYLPSLSMLMLKIWISNFELKCNHKSIPDSVLVIIVYTTVYTVMYMNDPPRFWISMATTSHLLPAFRSRATTHVPTHIREWGNSDARGTMHNSLPKSQVLSMKWLF